MPVRNVVVLEHISLDGVIQAPGGPDEDVSGGFAHGGWTGPYADDVLGTLLRRQMALPFDLLVGRTTFDIWEPYWPHRAAVWPGVNAATKYVASRTRTASDWQPSVFLNGDVAAHVARLKHQAGPDLHVWGSSMLAQTLMAHGLIDAFWLMIYPVTLGSGKRLFAAGAMPTAFAVTSCVTSSRGVIVVTYERAGPPAAGNR